MTSFIHFISYIVFYFPYLYKNTTQKKTNTYNKIKKASLSSPAMTQGSEKYILRQDLILTSKVNALFHVFSATIVPK